MSQFLHDAKAVAIPQVFSENSRAKKREKLSQLICATFKKNKMHWNSALKK